MENCVSRAKTGSVSQHGPCAATPDRGPGSHIGCLKEKRQPAKLIFYPYSPAYMAAWLIYGFIFALAVAHFLAVPWFRSATIVFYCLPFVWIFLLAWKKFRYLWPPVLLDRLFLAFVFWVLCSLARHKGFGAGSGKFVLFLFLMAALPYLCGRLMQMPDIKRLLRITLFAGGGISFFSFLDRFTSSGQYGSRWIFFSHNYGALLVGMVLAITLIALCVLVLDNPNPGKKNDRGERLVYWVLMWVVMVFMLWVKARGWLLAGLTGLGIICLFARHLPFRTRIGVLFTVLAIPGIALMSLSQLYPGSWMFYKKLFIPPHVTVAKVDPAAVTSGTGTPGAGKHVPGPILGADSCQPLKHINDSVAIRWLLCREAFEMFLEYPVQGVGASRFGEYSCAGPGAHPHNLLLQGFSELGIIGGGLLLWMFVLAGNTLVKSFFFIHKELDWKAKAFTLGVFAAFLVGYHIYGDYFTSVGMWLILGIPANIRANVGKGNLAL